MKSKIIVLCELILFSTLLKAQTGGPGQPEFMQFQQVGTSNLVNPATGTFSYQIPMFTIGGYPMNLTYQAGIQMEDVASMVGLGWNLNAGSIVRTLRGLPDDFNNDNITKEFNIKDNSTYGGKIGVDLEIAGLGQVLGASVNAELGVFYNNYKGWGIEHALGGSLSACFKSNEGVGGSASLGMGVAANSQTGIDKYISPSVGLKLGNSKGALSISLGKMWTVNSNEGQKSSLNTSLSYSRYGGTRKGIETNEKTGENKKVTQTDQSSLSLLGYSSRSYLNNSYQLDIEYPFENESGTFSGTLGWDAYFVDPSLRLTGYYSIQRLSTRSQSFPAVGCMYESNDNNANSLMDFNREKKLPYFIGQSKILPIPYKTPDIFNLNAQGLSMTFSVSKNDIGVVGDAQTIINSSGTQAGAEVNLGNMFKAGANFGTTTSFQQTDKLNIPITFQPYQQNINNNLYQEFYFKNHGEINKFDNTTFEVLGNYSPFKFQVIDEMTIPQNITQASTININQPVRQSTINYLTAEEASNMGFDKKLNYYSFDHPNSLQPPIGRVSEYRKSCHLSEMTVTQPDGMKYIFGIPVYNTTQKEVTFNVFSPAQINEAKNLVKYTEAVDNSVGNTNGTDYFFESTTTPAYVTQFLITAVLSPDYRDITNDGISDDDPGNYVKFNYFKEDSLYKWRTPYAKDSATYNKSLRSDPDDDKGNYVYGKKELWYVHSIESKTEIALFHYSKRKDGYGVLSENGGKDTTSYLRKLDFINVYSKPDYDKNNNSATPIKTIHFNYDYSLCKNIDNGTNNKGKLTLTSVAITYENSKKGMHTPYIFEYGKSPYGTVVNPDYNIRDVNRWGYFQKNKGFSDCDDASPLSNIDYPYSSQNRKTMDSCAYAWNLTDITIPGGSKLKVNYEANDYAYIQDKTAGQMFKISGLATYSSGNQLYSNYSYDPLSPSDPYCFNKIYFKLFNPITNAVAARKELEENYIKEIKDGFLYYKFYVELADNKYDYITGYAKISDYNVDPNNPVYAYVVLQPATLDDEFPAGSSCNPILKSALQFMRINRNRMIFNTPPDPSEPATIKGFMTALPGIMDQMTDQKQAFDMGINKFCLTRSYCQNIKLEKSFIRLYNPFKMKISGGARVKDISINDKWSAMAGSSYQDKSYTTYYEYTTTEISPSHDTLKISSGVADYEPMIGGDEISFKQPIFYSDIKKKAPDNDYYVEKPVNESLFPAPQIIYSKVTQITNKTNLDVGKTGKIINEFFTSKDFPVKVDMTTIDEKRDKTNFNAFQFPFKATDQQHDIATVSQGYSIELNNMSGLPKATWVYNEKGDRISGEVSEYFTDNNNFTTIDKSGNIHNNTKLGLSVEYTIDGRSSHDKSVTNIKQANLNMSMVSILPLLAVVPLFSNMTEEKLFQSIVTNKVIHRNALLKSKTVYSQTASVTTENLAFDEVTGEALLTKTSNEFNDSLYSFKYPAWWMYDGMGPSYVNTKLKINSSNIINTDPNYVDKLLKEGDELRSETGGPSLWVKKGAPTFKFEKDNKVVQTVLNDYYQVYNSGAKNLLSESAGQVVTWNSNPLSHLSTIFFNPDSILNSSAIEYYENAVSYCDPCRITLFRKNDYLSGKKGTWKPKRTWFYLTDRTPDNLSDGITNIRKEGLFKNYINDFWELLNNTWTIDSSNWEWKERVNLTDVDGQTIESEDRIGRKAANLLGYKNTLITAQAFNSTFNEAYFEGFEDFHYSYCVGEPTASSISADFMKRVLIRSGDGLIVDNESHTGKYALNIVNNLTFSISRPDSCSKTDSPVIDSTCDACVGGFYPKINKKYLFSCWVKVNKPQPILNCSDASVIIKSDNTLLATLASEGPVIEGWQRIMGTFTTLSSVDNLCVTLNKAGNFLTYYDDIRILPADGNMISYVYDDLNLRLTYILDENNYFTKYEYNQGELIRIKKATEKGIVMIKEGNQALTK